jgi:hypothetical protein
VLDAVTSAEASAGSPPAVTVLVAAGGDADPLAMTLESLAGQSVGHGGLEVVVQAARPAPGTREVVATTRAGSAHPVRLVEGGSSEARTRRRLALLAARGRHLTWVAPGDRLDPGCLDALVSAAREGVVPTAAVSEADGQLTPGGTQLNRHPNGVAGLQVPAALDDDAGKLVPTDWARQAAGWATPGAFWLALAARKQFRLRRLSADAPGYHRGPRAAERTFDDVLRRLDDIAALQEVARVQPAVLRAVRGLVLAHARQLNAHFLERPQDHRRFVAEVRRRELTRFPWAIVNRGLAHDLAIAYCFPPYQDTSAMVAARRLRERGVVTDVISANISRMRGVDPASTAIAAEVVDQTRVIQGPASFGLWSVMSAFAERTWTEMQELERHKGPYRSVYSRAMAVNSHLAAAVVKIRRPEIPWLAEFSDPLKVHPNAEERASEVGDDWLSAELRTAMAAAGHPLPEDVRLFELAELVTYALADDILFTNENQREVMLGYCPDRALVERARRISRVQHHPTLPFDFYTLVEPDDLGLEADTVNIAYFGVFYLTRGLGEVTAALEQLAPGVRRRVRLHVFTNRDDHLELEKFSGPLADVVRVHRFVPFLQFLNLTTRFDVLLVNDAAAAQYHGMNPYLPSKLSDYLGSGTPVWAVAEAGSVLDSLPTAYSSELGDVAGAKRALEQMARDYRRREPAR